MLNDQIVKIEPYDQDDQFYLGQWPLLPLPSTAWTPTQRPVTLASGSQHGN